MVHRTNDGERRTLYAGVGGYAVDAFDFMIYSFLIPTLIATWGMTKRRSRHHRDEFADLIGDLAAGKRPGIRTAYEA
jgi:hypothetical protein